MTLTITAEEYDARLANVRMRMDLQGMSALLVTDPANIYYLTGYNAWSFYTPQLLFVPAEGDMVLFTREMDAGGAHRTSWLPPEQIVGYPERYVHRPHLHPYDWIAFAIRSRWLVAPSSKGVVGMEMDAHGTTPKGLRSLEHGIPEWKIVDCFELVNWARVVKSEAEVQLMRTAARVTNRAMQAAIDTIDVGVPQNVVAAKIAEAQALGAEDAWGDYPAIVPLLPTGESADTPHLTWTDRRFERGDPVIVELAGAHQRYHVPLARTVILGTPTDDMLRLEEAVAAGLEALLAEARPGVVVSALSHAWNWKLAEYGLEKPSRLGYSIGIGYPPDWGERTISIRSEEEHILEENHTFHIICGMWMEGYGYELSESVRITSTGVETFTSFPRSLIRP
ncbi:MAG: M24 family metallopeptidase [Mobilicoccus sp.]|nr:M24 family metallopeptidase [Mobilicoccus sp.]